MAANIPIGEFNFETVELDHDTIALILQGFIRNGLRKTRLTRSMISLDVLPGAGPGRAANVSILISHGMPIFDAIAYLSIPDHLRDELIEVEQLPDGRTTNLQEMAEGVAYLFFFLITRAHVPVGQASDDSSDIPNFLRTFLNLNLSRDAYMQRIASFSLGSIEHKWIRSINMTQLPDYVRTRLALGVAGYRLFAPFRYYEIVEDADENTEEAYNAVRNYALSGFSWDVHPITRSMALLGRTGPLNANLGNLILDCFSDEQIADMVALKVIHRRPVRNQRAMDYLSWTDDTFGAIENLMMLN